MRKVAKLLTDYVIKKSMVDEADREVYEYGFVITLEVGLFLVASLFIALKLDMVLEGIFFFVIFFFFVYCVVGFWFYFYFLGRGPGFFALGSCGKPQRGRKATAPLHTPRAFF